MTTNAVAYFEKGGRTLDINSGRYAVADDFVPPLVAITPLFSEGTSANRYGGGVLIDKQAHNRTWGFGLHIAGSSDVENRRALADVNMFLGNAGDEGDPLYLVYDSNSDVSAEPIWGQRRLRFEIVFGQAKASALYGVYGARAANLPNCEVTLQIKPYAVGKKQQLGLASGGVSEDVYGSPDGQSRGLQVSTVSPTGGNEFTNPVFGNATYTTGWTIDASLDDSQNTNPTYLLPGIPNSIRLTSRGAGQEIFMSINTGDTNTHTWSVYAKLPDGGVVSSTQVVLFYSVALTTTYTPVGNGWYRLTASGAGISAGTNTGAQIKSGYTVYLTGFQMEEAAVATPLFYGDLLGCAWSGTVHASSSTRAVGACKVPINTDTFRPGAMTVRVVVKFYCDNTFATNISLFDARDGSNVNAPVCYFAAANDDFRLDMGGVSIDSSSQTFAVGDIIVLHFTGDETNGVAIYKDGVSIASSASFNPATLASYFYIGSDYNPTAQGPVTIMDVTTWDVALTAVEALADYNAIAPLVADDQCVSRIPYLWTDGGDGVIDACDGVVSSAAKNNWGVADGIPGSAPAVTNFNIQTSVTLASIGELKISNNAMDYFRYPTDWCWFDMSGTADSGASSGDAYQSGTVDTTGLTAYGSASTILDSNFVQGRDALVVIRLYDAGASEVDYILSTSWGNFSSKLTASAAFRLWTWGEISFQSNQNKFIPQGLIDTFVMFFAPDRTSGTGTVRMDYFAILVKPVMVLPFSSAYSNQGLMIQGLSAAEYVTSTSEFTQTAPVTGDVIELVPNKRNILVSLMGNNANDATVTRTFTYTKIVVTPRYALL